MEILKSTVFCICCGAIGLSLTTETLAAERFRRQLRLIAVLFLLITALSQLRTLDLSVFTEGQTAATQSADEIAERARSVQEQAVADALCRSLNQALDEHKVPCEVTRVELHISESGSIEIDRAFISGNLLTGTVYLREWLGADTDIRREDAADE